MALSLLERIPESARVTVDSAPIIYVLEGHPLAGRFAELFAAVEEGRNSIAISTITLAEVLSGPLKKGRDALAKRYRSVLTTSPGWSVAAVDLEVAETAARVRARSHLRLPDAIQVATAIHTSSFALVTHDRDFSKVRDVRVLGTD